MKVFVCLLAVVLAFATVSVQGSGGSYGGSSGGSSYGGSSGGGSYGGSSGGGGYGGSSGGGGYGGSSGGGGYGGSSGGGGYGGGGSISAPACPRNYLFSCQPRLSPAPCSSSGGGGYGSGGGGGYGSSGSYSENVPIILTAPYGYPEVTQNFELVSSYRDSY